MTIIYHSVYNRCMKNENSSETILNCALQLFSEKGYDGVGVNEIAEMAQVKKPTLYYFFGSKEGLFRELLQSNYNRLNEALAEVCCYQPHQERYNEDVYPVLLRIAMAYFDFAMRYPDFYLMSLALAFAPPTSQPAKIAEEYHKVQYGLVEKTFSDIASVHGNMRGKERAYAWRFMALINAQIGFWYRQYATLNHEEAQSLVKQFMHGIYS